MWLRYKGNFNFCKNPKQAIWTSNASFQSMVTNIVCGVGINKTYASYTLGLLPTQNLP